MFMLCYVYVFMVRFVMFMFYYVMFVTFMFCYVS